MQEELSVIPQQDPTYGFSASPPQTIGLTGLRNHERLPIRGLRNLETAEASRANLTAS